MTEARDKPTILCVDDDELVLRSLRRQLRRIVPHAKIELMSDGLQALELLSTRFRGGRPFSLLIVDQVMPKLTGDELLVRATIQSPDTYQVMLTGEVDGITVGRAVNEAQLFRFISKPWSEEELTVTVQRALDFFQRDHALREEQQANEELASQLRQSQKMELLGTLSGGIAHDFNNLLSVILLSAEGLQDDLRTNQLTTERHTASLEAVHDILSACGQATKLTRQLLSLTRNTNDRDEPFSATEGLKESLKLLKRLLPQEVTLCHQLPSAQELYLRGSENAFQQVIMNLVLNARDAISGAGRIQISISPYDSLHSRVCLAGELSVRPYLLLSVSDSGEGISPEKMRQLFDPFFSSKGELGTGLGLTVVYNTVVRSMGGAIDVESDGETIFSIYLPLEKEAEKQRNESPPKQVPTRIQDQYQIALVEDQSLVRRALTVTLRGEGFEVIPFADGRSLLQWLARPEGQRLSLILSDIMMPEMSGPALWDRVQERYPELPFLFLTGYAGDMLGTRDISSALILRKPISGAELREKIYAEIERRAGASYM